MRVGSHAAATVTQISLSFLTVCAVLIALLRTQPFVSGLCIAGCGTRSSQLDVCLNMCAHDDAGQRARCGGYV